MALRLKLVFGLRGLLRFTFAIYEKLLFCAAFIVTLRLRDIVPADVLECSFDRLPPQSYRARGLHGVSSLTDSIPFRGNLLFRSNEKGCDGFSSVFIPVATQAWW